MKKDAREYLSEICSLHTGVRMEPLFAAAIWARICAGLSTVQVCSNGATTSTVLAKHKLWKSIDESP